MSLTKAHKIHVSATAEALKQEIANAPWLPISAEDALSEAGVAIGHASSHVGRLYGPPSASRAIDAIARARAHLDRAEAYIKGQSR